MTDMFLANNFSTFISEFLDITNDDNLLISKLCYVCFFAGNKSFESPINTFKTNQAFSNLSLKSVLSLENKSLHPCSIFDYLNKAEFDFYVIKFWVSADSPLFRSIA